MHQTFPLYAVTRRGSVILFVLGVLAILALLGTALLFMTREEESAVARFMDTTRAEFAAESGFETALAKLNEYQGSLSNIQSYFQYLPDTRTTPIEYLRQSSFGTIDSTGDGFKDLAGYVSETHTRHGDCFKLRVESCQNKLNVNDSNSALNIDTDPYEDQWTPEKNYNEIPIHLRCPGAPGYPDRDPDWLYPDESAYKAEDAIAPAKPYPKAKGRLWNILKELTNVLFPNEPTTTAEDGFGNPAQLTVGERVSNAVFKARSSKHGKKFSSLSEVRDCLVPQILNPGQYLLLESNLTLHSWLDSNILIPTFQWRINTPYWSEANNPLSAHCKTWPADCEHNLYQTMWTRPVCRPGYSTTNPDGPHQRGKDLTSPVVYDFNFSGTLGTATGGGMIPPWTPWNADIQAFDPENPHAYCEEIRHDRDIYFYSDMQTRYFAKESRSPVDINQASLALLEALIRPVQGWYLKEAPSTWEGESPRARAEDWSQPGNPWGNYAGYGYDGYSWFPFLWCGRMWEFNLSGFNMLENDEIPFPDTCQYYYYDSYARNFCDKNISIWNGGDFGDPASWSTEPPTWVSPNGAAAGFWVFPCYCQKNGRFGELKESKAFTEPLVDDPSKSIAKALAEALYNRVHPDADMDGNPESYHPFQTWEEFENYILTLCDSQEDDLLSGDLRDFDIYMAHALIANFNPNSRINDYNPDKRFYLHVDKSQLSGFSAEACFKNMGVFDIESFGRSMTAGGETKADVKVQSTVILWDCFRVTNQSQFLNGYQNSQDAKNILQESNGENPTSGADMAFGQLSSVSFHGYSLQSYPEPEVIAGNFIQSSEFDGYLMLATLKPDIRDLLAGDVTENRLYVNFEKTMQAEFSFGNPEIVSDNLENAWTTGIFYSRRQDPTGIDFNVNFLNDDWAKMPSNNPSTRALMRHLRLRLDASNSDDAPGNLYPDGSFSDVGRGLRYEALNNIGDETCGGRKGTLQFWIKPGFDVAHSNRIRKLFSCPPRRRSHWNMNEFGYSMEMDSYVDYGWEMANDFTLYYFSRAGKRVPEGDTPNSLLEIQTFGYYAEPSITDQNWIATRSLFLHAGFQPAIFGQGVYGDTIPLRGIGTNTTNQSWRWWANPGQPVSLRQDVSPMLDQMSHFETRQWSQVCLSWDWVGEAVVAGMGLNGGDFNPPTRFFQMTINGNALEVDREMGPSLDPNDPHFGNFGSQGSSDGSPYGHYLLKEDIQKHKDGSSNYLSFGEISSAQWNNVVADSTYDDIITTSKPHNDSEQELEFQYGRYYCGPAAYTSPEFDIFSLHEPKVKELTLSSIEWTAYMPLPPKFDQSAGDSRSPDHPRFNGNRNPNLSDIYNSIRFLEKDAMDNFPEDPMLITGRWGGNFVPFSVDILNPETGKWHYEDSSVTPQFMPNCASGSRDADWIHTPLRWKRVTGNKLRFKIHFNTEDAQTLYTSPIFDDITFIFKLDNAGVLAWEKS